MSTRYHSLVSKGNKIKNLASSNLEQAISEFNIWKSSVKFNTKDEEQAVYDQICSALMFQENPFSKSETLKSLKAAIEVTTELLTILPTATKSTLGEEAALIVVGRILRNFHKHLEEMYQRPVHGRGSLKKEDLDKIKIGNEYDVQRILFSLLRPVFPLARVEVCSDGGYSGTRFDILIDEYDIVIEVKCTRQSMGERTLTEEVGADIYHYDRKHIMFLIFDKEKIISNIDAFESNYTKKFRDKDVGTYIVQPVTI